MDDTTTACHITGSPPRCTTHDVLATDWTTADDGPTASADGPTCPLSRGGRMSEHSAENDAPVDYQGSPAECNGICVMGWEILEGARGVAYPHPECDLHSPGWWKRFETTPIPPGADQ